MLLLFSLTFRSSLGSLTHRTLAVVLGDMRTFLVGCVQEGLAGTQREKTNLNSYFTHKKGLKCQGIQSSTKNVVTCKLWTSKHPVWVQSPLPLPSFPACVSCYADSHGDLYSQRKQRGCISSFFIMRAKVPSCCKNTQGLQRNEVFSQALVRMHSSETVLSSPGGKGKENKGQTLSGSVMEPNPS